MCEDENTICVTEEDIIYVERVLLEQGNTFDKEERVPIIKDFKESFDVNACPGSGKTTVLLAKLIILANKLPLKYGRGICVLTHTNVAIDEIKKKLEDNSDILFKYPNYFGTIQSFVDKYLTIPFFKRQTNMNINSIDDDIYYNHIRKLSKEKYDCLNRTFQYMIDKGLYTRDSFTNNLIRFVQSKHLVFIDGRIYISDYSGATLETKNYYKELEEIMYEKTFLKGILRYEDAFVLGKEYVTRYGKLKNYFSKRFSYVFIDEMQDTQKQQQIILDKIFDARQVIIQRFGDLNQNIGGSGNDKYAWTVDGNTKLINSSMRYGENLIKFLSPLRVVRQGVMSGNNEIKTINPHIIIFNDSNISLVVQKFKCIIKEYNIQCKQGETIKVIGKIGIEVEKPNLSIKSYTDKYYKHGKKDTFNKKVCSNLKDAKTLKSFYDYIISIIILSLDKDGYKISKDEFLKIAEFDYNELFMAYRSNIVKWYYNIKIEPNEIFIHIKDETIKLLTKFIQLNFNSLILEECIDNDSSDNNELKDIAVTKTESGSDDIEDVNTIFGVKGETHLATLYLESKLVYGNGDDSRSDILKILDYMLDKKESVDKCDEEALFAAYVAMSRAKILTCIAIHYDTIKGRIKEFKDYGYVIIGCESEIQELIDIEMN